MIKRYMVIVTYTLVLFGGMAFGGKSVEKAESQVLTIESNPIYVGAGIIWNGVSFDCPCGDRKKDSVYGGLLRLGYDFNPYFGIEARLLHANMDITFAKTTHYGIYAKPQYHIAPLVNIYALAGYGHTSVKCVRDSFYSFEKSGFSFGAGIEVDLSGDKGIQGDAEEGWGLFLDWQNLANKSGKNKFNVNVISAGLTYDF